MSVDGLETDFQATALLQFGSVFMQKGIGMTLLKLLQDGEFGLLTSPGAPGAVRGARS